MSYFNKAEVASLAAAGTFTGGIVGVAVQNIQQTGFFNALLGARVGLLGMDFGAIGTAAAIGGAVALAGCVAISVGSSISSKLSERRAESVRARHVNANNGKAPSL